MTVPTCPEMPTKPAKPRIKVERIADGYKISDPDLRALSRYIVELESGY